MTSWPHVATAALWIGWALYWAAMALRTKPTERQENGLSRLAYAVPLLIGAWLMVDRSLPFGFFLHGRFVPDGWATEGAGLAIAVAGFAFTVWARIHLGSNWSGMVTIKQGHDLIQTGPYGYVRHPIYTGLLTAVLGTALVLGEWRDLVALALIFASCWYKLRMEEKWMSETFGSAYADYRRRVATLVPFLL